MPAPQESPPQQLEPQVSESRRPEPRRFGERPLLLYDGECGLCSRTVRFVLRRDRLKRLRFAALRSAAGEAALRAAGLQPEPSLSTVVLLTADGEALVRSDAALGVAADLRWPWRWATALRWVPRRLRDGAYRLVARHRLRIFGGAERCVLPDPGHEGRFLDRGSQAG